MQDDLFDPQQGAATQALVPAPIIEEEEDELARDNRAHAAAYDDPELIAQCPQGERNSASCEARC